MAGGAYMFSGPIPTVIWLWIGLSAVLSVAVAVAFNVKIKADKGLWWVGIVMGLVAFPFLLGGTCLGVVALSALFTRLRS